MHFVYIIYSESKDKYYFGESADLKRRLAQHNRKNVPSTAAGVPWVLVWCDVKTNREDALITERKLKNIRSRKRVIDFLNKYPTNPEMLAQFESTDDF